MRVSPALIRVRRLMAADRLCSQALFLPAHSSKLLMRGSVRWDESLDQAMVTIACQHQDAASAGDWARSFIRRQAEVMAHIHVRDVEIVETTTLPE